MKNVRMFLKGRDGASFWAGWVVHRKRIVGVVVYDPVTGKDVIRVLGGN